MTAPEEAMNLFSTPPQNANYPMSTLPARQAQPLSANADRTSGCMTDGERECAIALAGSMVEHHMGEWQAHGCFTDRAAADVARLRMEALIKGRSAERLQAMAEEQRRRMALEPGAERSAV